MGAATNSTYANVRLWRPQLLAQLVLAVGFVFLLLLVFLTQVTEPPAFITGWRIAIMFVLFGVLAMTLDFLRQDDPDTWIGYALVLVAGFILVEGLYRYRVADFGPEGPHTLLLGLVFLALLGLVTVYPDPRAHRPSQWIFIVAFALVAGLFFYHAISPHAPTWPLWGTIVAGVAILVIPRFVPEWIFLWSLSSLAALTVVFALGSVVYGEYTFLFASVERWDQTVPLLEIDVDGWYGHTSLFNNVNVFGLVTFGGLSAAAFLFHRSWHLDSFAIAFLASSLFIVNGIGLILSNSGVAWMAAFGTLAFYTAYVAVGRQILVPAFVLGIVGAAIGIWLVYVGTIDLDDSGRFERWLSGWRAFRNDPSLFGHGHISTVEFTGPYIDGDPDEPHNSYLDMLIRIGVVGLFAYAVVLIGGMLYGLIRYKRVNVAMLAFTFGWAFHHLFESYTMMQWTIPAVLSALAVGYLVFGDWVRIQDTTAST